MKSEIYIYIHIKQYKSCPSNFCISERLRTHIQRLEGIDGNSKLGYRIIL